MSTRIQQRRRGPELESALLDASWLEMTQSGVSNLTMESVARRAHTGVAVLYRRWPNKESLVLATLRHYREANPVSTPDTGTLRGDLIGALTSISTARAKVFALAGAAYLSGLVPGQLLNPEQTQERIVGEKKDPRSRPAYRRADARGEISLNDIPASVLDMPFDLVRYELVMTFSPVSRERITSIVDEMFMPLVAAYSTPPGGHTASPVPSPPADSPTAGAQIRHAHDD
ncbi:MAG: TetR/AcrR family transcriptional regulator [Bifidobacterium sp.]|jgi:AcrR family transcriptional regulator